MNTIKAKWNVLYAIASVTYKEWAAYRTHSMVSILVGPISYLIQFSIWTALYQDRTSLGGMTLENILSYSAVVATISYLTMDFADWNLQMLIHTGKYLTFALRPLHHRHFALCQKIGHRVLGLIFEYIPVMLIFLFIFRVHLIPKNPFWAILSIALAFLMNFYLNYCIGLAGFWFTKTSGLRGMIHLFSGVLSGAIIPLSIFPDIFQKIFFFLPFQFISYVPAMVYTGEYTLGGMTLSFPFIISIQAFYVFLMFLFSELLYRLGNRKFTGVGA